MLNHEPIQAHRSLVSLTPLNEPSLASSRPTPTSALAEDVQQGQQAGQAEFQRLLTTAARIKGTPLTADELLDAYRVRFRVGMKHWEAGRFSRDWYSGWCQGFVEAYLQTYGTLVAQATSSQPPTTPLTPLTFRKATILVDAPDEFLNGILCGQACQVDEALDGEPLTVLGLYHDLAEAVTNDLTIPATWLVGFLLGRVDALLRGRKSYPPTW
jgi:hypothetical protein